MIQAIIGSRIAKTVSEGVLHFTTSPFVPTNKYLLFIFLSISYGMRLDFRTSTWTTRSIVDEQIRTFGTRSKT
jgi:hypothetical protein